ncbi:replicative DNA helicase [Ferrithrix thermotolerans DSM 19514]|uniref:Replicative DNA helicase n=1 Tax=Ferrithrix thermotolerans DSM 19514 TaxID=1121881 RepID=A0A1M4WYK2_9ACTN|nr:replicative DNA helicase [Ferrithrix thermotolerans]SHE86371.1 replicative DNA helicase [Ferrithrix thermotolerans DSM 19514]
MAKDPVNRDVDSSRLEGILGRVAPHSIEAEESLLGAMMLSREAVAEAVEIVREGDFFKPSHGYIFKALATLHAEGGPNDVVSVAEELRRSGHFEVVGGLEALIALQASTPAIGSAARYAQLVEEYSLLRKLIKVATDIAELAYSLPSDVASAVDLAEAKIFEVAEHRSSETMHPLRDVLIQTLDDLEALYGREEGVTGLPTGFVDLDEILSGLHPSNLLIVGARPGMGKTSFALGLGVNVAKKAGLPVLMFSLEMSHLELTQRLVAAEARVDSTRLRSGRLQDRDWEKIHGAISRLAEAKIYIDDDPNLTVMDIRARARRLKAREGLGLVIVDYLQLMSGRRNVESRQVEVSEISRGLKILARELNVPVVALSQLSRNLEARADKRPQLADLRESGCLSGETLIRLADGTEARVLDLWRNGRYEVELLSFDDETALSQAARSSSVFMTGVKETYRIDTLSGLSVRATKNHKFFTPRGWLRLDEMTIGDVIYKVSDSSQGGLGSQSSRAVAVGNKGSLALADKVTLSRLAEDVIVNVSFFGVEPVFDVSVPKTHSFVANGFAVHNSLEQDADVVMFIYRDEVYTPDTHDKGTAEIIVAKHRSGPTGTVYLAFLNSYTLFANMASM